MKKFTFQKRSKKMLSTCIRGQIMPTRNKPQKINKRVTTSPYKTNGKTTEYLLIHNLPAGEKNSLEQAAFRHEVKVLCCLLIPTAGRQDRQYVFPLNSNLPCPLIFPPHHRMFQWLRLLPYRNLPVVQASDIFNSLPKSENVRDVCLDCLDSILVTFKPPAFRSRAYCDCNPIRAFETFDISNEPIKNIQILNVLV